jgi:hypothetical protein
MDSGSSSKRAKIGSSKKPKPVIPAITGAPDLTGKLTHELWSYCSSYLNNRELQLLGSANHRFREISRQENTRRIDQARSRVPLNCSVNAVTYNSSGLDDSKYHPGPKPAVLLEK